MVAYSDAGYKPGASLRAFRDFFETGMIFGGDIQPDCMFEEERIKTLLFDSTNEDQCNEALGDIKFDIIIDDGLHIAAAQLKTFQNLWHRLNSGGYYIIEDISNQNPLYDQWKYVFSEIESEKWTNEYRNMIIFLKY